MESWVFNPEVDPQAFAALGYAMNSEGISRRQREYREGWWAHAERSKAFIMGAAQFLFVFNFFYSLWRGPKAPANPWEVGTLEWTVVSPPPHHNFDVIPQVHVGPHELGHPRVIEKLGRDFLAQNEELPE